MRAPRVTSPSVPRTLSLPKFVIPAAPRLVTVPPIGALWSHEPKLDGWRCQLAKAGPAIALYTRHGHDLASRARAFVQRAAAEIREPRVLLDGEMVALGDDGRTDFNAVRYQLRRSPERLFYFAFDILFCGALDLRSLALERRREYLQSVLGEAGAPWLASVAVVPDGVNCSLSVKRSALKVS